MFGKPLSAYLRFPKTVLIVLGVVGLLRLGLSVAGLPDSAVRWVSMNAVAWGGAIYYGVTAYKTGFGGYKHLLPLALIQTLVFQAVAVLGILLSLAGLRNIYTAPEYTFGGSQGAHLVAHLTIGIVVPTLIVWGIASLAMLITKKSAPRPAVA